MAGKSKEDEERKEARGKPTWEQIDLEGIKASDYFKEADRAGEWLLPPGRKALAWRVGEIEKNGRDCSGLSKIFSRRKFDISSSKFKIPLPKQRNPTRRSSRLTTPKNDFSPCTSKRNGLRIPCMSGLLRPMHRRSRRQGGRRGLLIRPEIWPFGASGVRQRRENCSGPARPNRSSLKRFFQTLW
jgi:hypothetical protein